MEGGELLDLESDVIGHADHTFVIADESLLRRLRTKYPALDTQTNVTIADSFAALHEALEVIEQDAR